MMVMTLITVTRTGDHSKSGDVYDDMVEVERVR